MPVAFARMGVACELGQGKDNDNERHLKPSIWLSRSIHAIVVTPRRLRSVRQLWAAFDKWRTEKQD